MFRPHQEHVWKPDVKYEEVFIDNKINCWYFHHYPNKATVLFCHGNSGNISHRNYVVDLVLKQELNLLIFDYQGYGKSAGECEVENILKDADNVYKWLSTKTNNIILWGESLGGAPASYLASKYPINRLVLWATFASLSDMAEHKSTMRYLYKPLAWVTSLLIGEHNICRYMKNVKCPTLIVHSINDNIIPVSNAEINYKAIPHNNKMLLYIDGSHSKPILTNDDMKRVLMFLKDNKWEATKVLSPAGSPFSKIVNEFEDLVDRTLKMLRI